MTYKPLNESILLDVYRLKDIKRYNTRRHIKDESVAEHSFYVALIALQICIDNHLSQQIVHDCVVKAILHDMPEMELNDITHDVKERLNLRSFLKKYEDEYYEKNYSRYTYLMNDNDNALVNLIVDLADTYSVLQFAANEYSIGNTSTDIQIILADAENRIIALNDKLSKLLGGQNE